MIPKPYCRTRSLGESALAVSSGCDSIATSMVRKLPLLLDPDPCCPTVVYTRKMETGTLGLLWRLFLVAETTEAQPLLQLCFLTPAHGIGRTGIVFGILAAKESGSTARHPRRGLDIQAIVYSEGESLGFREDDPTEVALQPRQGGSDSHKNHLGKITVQRAGRPPQTLAQWD